MAYELRISDWSSDVCSSDLVGRKQVVDAGAVAAVRADFLTRQAERNNKRFRGENGIVDDFLRLHVEFIIAGDPLTVELVDHKRNADFGTVAALEAPTAPKFGGDGVAVANELLNTRHARGHRGRQTLVRKSTRLNSSHYCASCLQSSASQHTKM